MMVQFYGGRTSAYGLAFEHPSNSIEFNICDGWQSVSVELPSFLKSGEKARLIPVSPSGQKERHAASIFLATLSIVEPFARDVFETVGKRVGQRSQIHTFIEVVFKQGPTDKNDRPDGLLILDTSQNQWRALIEAKIGTAKIDADQVEKYVTLARANNIDAVITISNELTALPEQLPYNTGSATNGKVEVFHWSWMRLVTTATVLIGNDESFDPEQQYILKEMLRYLTHDNIGIRGIHRMNSDWKPLMSKIHAGGIINKNDPEVVSTIQCWHQEAQDICLIFSRKLKIPVSLSLKKSHRDDQRLRISDDASELAESKRLTAVFEIPDIAGHIEVVAHCLRRNIICRMRLTAPADLKRYTSRLNWLLRQLPDGIDPSTSLTIHWKGGGATFASVDELRENPDIADIGRPNALPRKFEISIVRDLAQKYFGPASFVDGLESAVPDFYDSIARHVVPWHPPPPIGPVGGEEESLSSLIEDAGTRPKRDRKLVKRGEIEGRAFSVFDDGSIEVETNQGVKWFKNLADLQATLP